MTAEISEMFWICSVACIASALLATLMKDVHRIAIALWVCGLSVGGIFLSFQAEVIAVIQWILATLSAVVFLFFSTLFGSSSKKIDWLRTAMAAGLGLIFVASIFGSVTLHPVGGGGPSPGLSQIGQYMVKEHFISIEVLSLVFLFVMVGVGVVARPGVKKK